MKKSSITYGQLYDQLGLLHFGVSEVQKNGKLYYMFEHDSARNALIVLPERDRNDYVELPFIRSVLSTLKGHDLVAESNPVDLLTAAFAEPHQ